MHARKVRLIDFVASEVTASRTTSSSESPYVADELRLARLQARTAWENVIRADRSSRAAANPQAAARHRDLARVWQSMHMRANGIAGTLATADETRRQWAALTEPTRRAPSSAMRASSLWPPADRSG
jgi:hypothetical protein